MMRVLFFARLRETLQLDAVEIDTAQVVSENISDVASLKQFLVHSYGDSMAEALSSPQLVCAVNHQVVDTSLSISDGDEIAFYPPVTGG